MPITDRDSIAAHTCFADTVGRVWNVRFGDEAVAELAGGGFDLPAAVWADPDAVITRFSSDNELFVDLVRAGCLPGSAEFTRDDFRRRVTRRRRNLFAGVAVICALAIAFPDIGRLQWWASYADEMLARGLGDET